MHLLVLPGTPLSLQTEVVPNIECPTPVTKVEPHRWLILRAFPKSGPRVFKMSPTFLTCGSTAQSFSKSLTEAAEHICTESLYIQYCAFLYWTEQARQLAYGNKVLTALERESEICGTNISVIFPSCYYMCSECDIFFGLQHPGCEWHDTSTGSWCK